MAFPAAAGPDLEADLTRHAGAPRVAYNQDLRAEKDTHRRASFVAKISGT